ncbi:P-loop containing nucleoside triphosphate hydrolases superfamilyprotein [Zostera marina]|uniref:p-loop containing nucleoside triphosphate hydrolases superfamilyprotein n=1 Tax=Zostera marina TaxID=29655 RepID=A0A0K9P0H5_ZOSMR|nr:P-loop containing nucleoside triphosphate hydrolases superfamilyprotein [Zostera marina]
MVISIEKANDSDNLRLLSDDSGESSKDVSVVRSPRKSPLVLRMIVLAFVMLCGIYISSICLKQLGFNLRPNLSVQVTNKRCPNPSIAHSDLHLLHYPNPLTYTREECECTPVRLFAIFSMQRSGSGWFETLLNNHINISSNGEIFSHKERRNNISSITNTLDKLYNLDWFSSAAKNECTASVGLKWMLNQGVMDNHHDIVDYFNRRGVSAIFLFRRNLLRRMVSVLANLHDRDTKPINGTHMSHVHSKDEASILAQHKPAIDTHSLISELKKTEEMVADALNYFNSTRHTILFYEDIITNQTKVMDVLDFLNVPRRKLVSLQVKIHTNPLSEQIENWNDVYKTLNGTQYETFLNADYRL